MPDFIQARFAAHFVGLSACCVGAASLSNTQEADRGSGTAASIPYPGGTDGVLLVRPHWLLTGSPERSWEHQTAQFNLIGRAYGEDVPTGNARLSLAFETTRRAPSVAQLERELRYHELALNLHRRGTLTLQEAWHGGAPMLTTRWQCLINACTPRRLTSEDAPPLPGAWGAVAYELILTNPEQLS